VTKPKPLQVGIVGCGLIGRKRAEALGLDQLVGCFDVVPAAAEHLANDFGGVACSTLEHLYGLNPDVIVVAVTHDNLADVSCGALESGAHVLVEKPAGIGVEQVDRIVAASIRANRLVKVGFNHRFHSGIARAITEATSGDFGNPLYLRARYGHGGRLGYEREWRTDPIRSGGGEIIDQGMHLLDLSYWLLGELPVWSSLLKTHFWRAPVDDNAVMILADSGGIGDQSPWALLHVSWTEWKNMFSMEVVCERAKWAVEGLVRSYGAQQLTIYRMRPELGPPDIERVSYPERDESWEREWHHFAEGIRSLDGRPLLGDLTSARYAWSCVEEVQAG
jgi:predicted dehydrogenase